MPAVQEVTAVALGRDGVTKGHLRIALLPRSPDAVPPPLLSVDVESDPEQALAPIQLLEGYEYRYEWEGLPNGVCAVVTDPAEAFQPDTPDGLKGRLRPGLSTGVLQVGLRSEGETLAQLELEVRSRKLNYLSEYQWMLRDIADQMTELVMERFAPSVTHFTQAETRDAVTLYQRYAFLRALLNGEEFQTALSEVTRRPHVAWEELHESIFAGQSIKAGSDTIRQFARPGVRVLWEGGPVQSVPLKLDRKRTEATHDTTPNRFVRFALERWRQVVADIDHGLAREPENAAVARGRREIARTLEQLDAALNNDLFKDLSALSRFPADDQVLQRRAGYRDVFRAYLEFELAARLSWRGTDSSYEAGQRDVATLYEYWVFLQLARLIASLTGQGFDLTPLIEARPGGLSVMLQQGKELAVSGFVERFGRRMKLELFFNRTFGRGRGDFSSWTRPMRPDCSLVISAAATEPAGFEPVLLHFDAKYKVEQIVQLFGEAGTGDEIASREDEGNAVRREGATREDLLKMHSYRDAIRRSAGAFVLYPGDDTEENRPQYSEYHELLPGLGAFVLRPVQAGDPGGVGSLRTFLDQVLDHVGRRLSHHERGRYWLEEVFGRYDVRRSRAVVASRPGPDTTVLLGFVKSTEHWDWIHKYKVYNVRSAGRHGGVTTNAEILFSQLLLLYCPDKNRVALGRIISGPEFVDSAAMKGMGYPNPSSDYLCVQISLVPRSEVAVPFLPEQIVELVARIGGAYGEPTAVRWVDLANMAPDPS